MGQRKDFLLLLSAFLFIVFSSVLHDYTVNKDREISHESDDNLSYLIPATNLKYCKNSECYEENFFKFPPLQEAGKSKTYKFERQIHRLIYDYTPLYTFLLDKISSKKNIYKSQEIFHLMLSLLSAIAILYYLKLSTTPKKVLLIAVIIGTHYCVNNWGIKSSLAWTVSTFIGSLAIILQFKMRKLSLFLHLIALLFHQIGLVLLVMGYIVFSIYNYNSIISIKNFFQYLKKEIFFIILYLVFIYIGLKFKYTAFDLNNLNVATVYSIDYFNILSLVDGWKNNFLAFTRFLVKTIIFLNPILFFFFLSSFFIKISDQFRIIKIFTIVFSLTLILFIHGVGEFAIGKRLWPIFVMNYLILSITAMYYYSKKIILINYIKILFLTTLPFFIILNVSLNIHPIKDVIASQNYQYDTKNMNKFKNLVDKNKQNEIYFLSTEAVFYRFISAGFIQNNIFHKWQDLSQKDITKAKYLVLDNPVRILRPNSDLLLKNNSQLKMHKYYEKFRIIVFSKKQTEFLINKKNYKINKGYSEISLSEQKLIFDNINTPIRIKGIKVAENQKTNWPWNEDVKFNFRFQEVQSHPYLFLKKYRYERSYDYNFIELGKKIDASLPNCKKNMISDIDSSLIISLKCINNN